MASSCPGRHPVSVALLTIFPVLGLGAHGQQADRKALVPVDAIKGIADALKTYAVIGLSPGEGHDRSTSAPASRFSLSQARDRAPRRPVQTRTTSKLVSSGWRSRACRPPCLDACENYVGCKDSALNG
jgi:hypothetical protein